MPYNPNFTPDAPLPISMLPDAEPLNLDDLLLVTQLGNTTGRSRRLSIGALINSTPLVNAPSGLASNVLDFSGALPQCVASYSSSAQMVAVLDVPVLCDVEFRVWGTSGLCTPTSQNFYEYGLTAITESNWAPDGDQDRRETHKLFIAKRYDDSSELTNPIGYSAVFPVPTTPKVPTDIELANYPTRRVKLDLSSGTSASLYQASPPSTFTLKIQAICKPMNYSAELLRSSL